MKRIQSVNEIAEQINMVIS
jgi:hypothetical protein